VLKFLRNFGATQPTDVLEMFAISDM